MTTITTIADAMRAAGLSQATAARLIGCSAPAVCMAIKRSEKMAVRQLAAVLSAWRIMSPAQREAWVAERVAATLAGESGDGLHAEHVARRGRMPGAPHARRPSAPAAPAVVDVDGYPMTPEQAERWRAWQAGDAPR